MTGNIVSSITYFDASSFAARTLGEENMAHFPPLKPRCRVLFGMRTFRQIFCQTILNPQMDLLREIQLEIEKRTLSRGGWASGNGRSATVETTCYALMALRDGKSTRLN